MPISNSPTSGVRQPRATRCQRKPGTNGTVANITSRSIRSGKRCASASPTEPQSWTTSEKRSSPTLVDERLEEAVVAVDRIVELGGLGRLAEAGQVRRDPAGPLRGTGPSRASASARRAGTGSERRRPGAGGCSSPATWALRSAISTGRGSYHHRLMADRRKVRAILDRLRREYGRPVLRPHRAPVDELILTVLSQNTNDRNRDVAYARLRERFSSWAEVAATPPSRRSRTRSAPAASRRPRPCGSSRSSTRSTTTTWRGWRRRRSTRRATTCASCPGVGRKTAACVLLFSYGRPEVPVDTHVYRVGTRLGLWPEGTSLEQAHDEMLRLVDSPGGGVRAARAADPPRAQDVHGAQPGLPGRARCLRMCPDGRRRLRRRMSETTLRRLSELALIGIASVWGLTFVMVQDAIRELPTMAFLAYRFIPGSADRRPDLPPAAARAPCRGLARGSGDGVFLTGGYVFQTLGLEETTASNTGFITGLFVVLTPVLGAVFLRQRIPVSAWVAAGVAMFGPLAAVRRRRRLRPARRRPRLPVRDLAGRAHPRDGERGQALRRGRAAGHPARRGGAGLARDRRRGRPARAARGDDRVVGADRHLAGRERARVLRPVVRAEARAARRAPR